MRRRAFYGFNSSSAMWRNLSGSPLIKRTWLNQNNSHPSVSLEPLIEMKQQIRQLRPKLFIYTNVLRRKIYSWMFSSNLIAWTPPSLNLSLSSSSRLIFASKEWLKVRFFRKNRENLSLECQGLPSKLRNEKPLIQLSIGSFRMLYQVRLCVFLLIFCPVSLDL